MKRQANFDLMRIICMLMIVQLHFSTHGLAVLWGGHFLPASNSLTDVVNYAVISLSVIINSIAVNCYVLQTGYFSVKPLKFSFNRILTLYLQVLLYSGVITLIFKMLHITDMSWQQVCLSFFPISSNSYWFFTQYIALVFLIPFLACIPEYINKRQFNYLLIVLLSINLTLLYSHGVFPFGTHYSGQDTLLWFVCLYYIGNYIRRFGLPKIIEKNATSFFILSIVVIFALYFSLNLVKAKGLFAAEPNHPLYNGVLIAPSLLFLVIFKNMSIKNEQVSKIIMTIAPLSFGVYLIHDHNCVRLWLWHNVLNVQSCLNTPLLILYIILIPLCVFMVCIIIDYFRQQLFSLATIISSKFTCLYKGAVKR